MSELLDLPRTLSTAEAAPLLGFSRGAVWAAARDEGGIVVDGEIIRPIRVGRALRWPTAPILAALGLSRDGLPSASPAPSACDSASNGKRPAVEPGAALVPDHREEVDHDGSG